MKTKARKRHDLGPSRAPECVEEFNRRHPVGSKVWYWTTLPFGPVTETLVRDEAFLADSGDPVVFLTGVSGYVSVFHVFPPNEEQREDVKPRVVA